MESLRHKRVGADLFTDVEISLAQAVLGGTVKVPGIEKDNTVRIPPGTSSHAQMCLRGMGIRKLNKSGRGDQFINVKIRIPKCVFVREIWCTQGCKMVVMWFPGVSKLNFGNILGL